MADRTRTRRLYKHQLRLHHWDRSGALNRRELTGWATRIAAKRTLNPAEQCCDVAVGKVMLWIAFRLSQNVGGFYRYV